MTQISDSVRLFFEAFEKASNTLDLEMFAGLYGDVFMFAGPLAAQPVRKEDFLKVLPNRKHYFAMLGLLSSRVTALEETRLDEGHIMVRVGWEMKYEKTPGQPILDQNAATYVLFQNTGRWQIIFQLDHQDLAQRAAQLGLLPAKE